ncbi:MAG: MotA/TolQ/ExbB proton channel family protein [Spirochaetaceae bacterium]|jgi:biopolymer transport protein ExbB|nr:MotA/TolQ/ExbB proton channel family protein [Spirochaetaceae bacterium]
MNNTENTMSLLELFNMGGVFMWPLLVFSMAAVAIAIERAVFIFRHNLSLDKIEKSTLECIKNGDMDGAVLYLQKQTSSFLGARVLLAMVKNYKLPLEHIRQLTGAEAASCINALEKGFNFLTALGSLSPLTGFLGTVSGMIGAFKSIAEATEVNAQIVANGIYEALITTVFGLIIAIIAMIAHSILSHVVDTFASEIDILCPVLLAEIAAHKTAQKTAHKSTYKTKHKTTHKPDPGGRGETP